MESFVKMIDKKKVGSVDGVGRFGEAGQGPQVKKKEYSTIQKKRGNIGAYQETSRTGGH